MTTLLDHAVDRLRTLPPETQDEFARILMRLAGQDDGLFRLTPKEAADLAAADAEILAGDLASEAEVEVVFAKHRA